MKEFLTRLHSYRRLISISPSSTTIFALVLISVLSTMLSLIQFLPILLSLTNAHLISRSTPKPLPLSPTPAPDSIFLDLNPSFFFPPFPPSLALSLPIPQNWSLACPTAIASLCEDIVGPDTSLPIARKDVWVQKGVKSTCLIQAWVPYQSSVGTVKGCIAVAERMMNAIVDMGAVNGVNRASVNLATFPGPGTTGSQVDQRQWTYLLQA